MTIFDWCDKNPSCYLSFIYVKDKVRVSSLSLLTFNEDLTDEDLKDPSFIPFMETARRNKNIKIQIHKFMSIGYRIEMEMYSLQLKYSYVIPLGDVKYSDMTMYTYQILDNGIRELTNAFLGRDK